MVLVVKNPSVNPGDVRDMGSIPRSGRSPGGGNGKPLQYFCWRIPWTEEPGGLLSIASQIAGHDWDDLARTCTVAAPALTTREFGSLRHCSLSRTSGSHQLCFHWQLPPPVLAYPPWPHVQHPGYHLPRHLHMNLSFSTRLWAPREQKSHVFLFLASPAPAQHLAQHNNI